MTNDEIGPVLRAALLGEVPKPAFRTVTIDRAAAEQLMARLEEDGPVAQLPEAQHNLWLHLRQCMDDEQPELWAVHSPGPGSCDPMISKDEAERVARENVEYFNAMNLKEGWEAPDLVCNVIPSPFHPDEHWQMLAEELDGEEKRMRALAKRYHAERDDLMASLVSMIEVSGTSATSVAASALLDRIKTADAPKKNPNNPANQVEVQSHDAQ